MSAELLDPWDRPAPTIQPPLSLNEVEAIGEEIRTNQFEDRGLIPELHAIGYAALCKLGMAGDREATQAVRRMLRRAKFGGPLDEDRS